MNRFALSNTFLLFLGIYFFQLEEITAVPNPRKIIKQDGSTYNEDDCEQSADRHAGKCAVIFEKSECDTPESWNPFGVGDEMSIESNKWINLRGTGFHEDVESIIVHPGCVIFGYDENTKTDRGTGISVSAVGKTDWVYRELKSHDFDLEDDIEAVECYCGDQAKLATQVLPLESSNFLEAIANWANVGTATNHCNMWIHAFNRLPVNTRPCAILFESEDCETSDGLLLKDWYKEILPSSNIENLPEISTGAKADSAEAILVRPGCTFFGYDEDNGQGKSVTVTAPTNSRIPKFHPLASKYNPFNSGLNEDIDSYKCTCT